MKKIIASLALIIATATSLPAISAYKEIEVSNGGSISGKINFTGKDPAAITYKVAKDTQACGTKNRVVDFVDVKNGALRDVVVYLDKVKAGKKFEKIEAKIDQKDCEFLPFLSVMTNNTDLEAMNSDEVLHNVHAYEMIGRAKKTIMNESQPRKGFVSTKKIKLRRGTGIKIECDSHDYMHAFMFIAKNPYYAVVAEDGSYTINDIPAGKYQIKAWHGTLAEQKNKVIVKSGESSIVDFTFKGK